MYKSSTSAAAPAEESAKEETAPAEPAKTEETPAEPAKEPCVLLPCLVFIEC